MSSRLPTSAVTATASQPVLSCARRAAISFSVSVLRAASTSFGPARAAASAVARPMPLVAPVITITCWASGLCLGSAIVDLLRGSDEDRDGKSHAGDAPLRLGHAVAEAFQRGGCERLRVQLESR